MELWDAYDSMRRLTGGVLVRGEPIPAGLRHLAVHIWYINSKGELLIQRRALTRKLAPGRWAVTGGSALKGETSADALVRESTEEMGIVPDTGRTTLVLSKDDGDCFCDVYLVGFDGDAASLKLQREEVMDAKWITRDEFKCLIGRPELFWQTDYMEMLSKYLDRFFPVAISHDCGGQGAHPANACVKRPAGGGGRG